MLTLRVTVKCDEGRRAREPRLGVRVIAIADATTPFACTSFNALQRDLLESAGVIGVGDLLHMVETGRR